MSQEKPVPPIVSDMIARLKSTEPVHVRDNVAMMLENILTEGSKALEWYRKQGRQQLMKKERA